MRYLSRLLCVMIVAGLTAASASAQGGGGAGGGGAGGGGGGAGGGGGGGAGGGGGGGDLSGGLSSGGQGGSIGQDLSTGLSSASGITAPGTTGGGGSTAVNASNIFSATFANPYYQGTPTNSRSNAAPGGFGQTLYTTSAGNAAGGRGATAGGARGGTASTANQFGTIISLPVQVTYPAIARFPAAPAIAAPKLQTDVAGMIGRSSMIANPAGIQVTADGSIVTLRGAAKDADEARMIAGMVRMTPGVRGVVNELSFPAP